MSKGRCNAQFVPALGCVNVHIPGIPFFSQISALLSQTSKLKHRQSLGQNVFSTASPQQVADSDAKNGPQWRPVLPVFFLLANLLESTKFASVNQVLFHPPNKNSQTTPPDWMCDKNGCGNLPINTPTVFYWWMISPLL